MPTANIADGSLSANPTYFRKAEVKAVVAATGLRIVATSSLTSLAGGLSEIAHRLFCARRWPTLSPAGEREAWARNVEKNTRALLANFGTDPGYHGVRPPADGIAVLFGLDQPLHAGPALLKNGATKLRSSEKIRGNDREAYQLLREMNFVDPMVRLNQWELEYLSINKGARSIPPRFEVVRVTLLGLRYIAGHAAFAQSYYAKRKRQPKPLAPEQIFFLGLFQIYKKAFGVAPTISTSIDPGIYKRGGPTIRFCQAVARHLLTCPALIRTESKHASTLRRDLNKWAHNAGAVAERIRDARATNPQSRVFRRQRNSSRASGNKPDK